MTQKEIQTQIQGLRSSGGDVKELRVEYYLKWVVPFSGVVFALIALSLALAWVKSSRDWWGIVAVAILALLSCGFFMTLMAVFRALGLSGMLSPPLAAWGASGIYVVLAGVLLLWKANR
jgi:lipopolysaccharide export system permease protein